MHQFVNEAAKRIGVLYGCLFYERDVEPLCSALNSTPVTVCIPAMRGLRCGLRNCLGKPCWFEALHLSSGRPDHGAIYVCALVMFCVG